MEPASFSVMRSVALPCLSESLPWGSVASIEQIGGHRRWIDIVCNDVTLVWVGGLASRCHRSERQHSQGTRHSRHCDDNREQPSARMSLCASSVCMMTVPNRTPRKHHYPFGTQQRAIAKNTKQPVPCRKLTDCLIDQLAG